jgi:hypothetical protein
MTFEILQYEKINHRANVLIYSDYSFAGLFLKAMPSLWHLSKV